jgi:hypothetical protein
MALHEEPLADANSGSDARRRATGAKLKVMSECPAQTQTLYSMADYLDARPRNRSESVNTDASSTLASPGPLALLTPNTNPKLTPLIGYKFPTNTILKSHGRPPWYI